ncbi:MAG: 4Fe-4S binding protein [Burkholderiaceae bacterium]|nr:4Fe-4S binding protein [Burkholderiaceae bacterium]
MNAPTPLPLLDARRSAAFGPAPRRPGRRRSALARLGDAMQQHRRVILGIQWVVVCVYLLLVVVPAFLPLPKSGERIVSNLALFAQFAFWGIWWPFVIASMFVVGRAWCGVFCPEGALTEFASRHGLGRSIPRWIRWSGWPFVAFACTTIYGQLISVYEYSHAALLILGGSTVLAVAVGLVYGRNNRVWCRYLCPVSGVFGLLAKVAPVHFAVDPEQWKRHPGRAERIDCAPLIDVRHMTSASDCHSCGRCSGHRDAVALELRRPNAEILSAGPRQIGNGSAILLLFGMLGLATGAFQWTLSPWFVAMRQGAAQWLVEHDSFLLLRDDAPWWLLTHYPEASDVFTWLDGIAILVYIGGYALLAGGLSWLALRAAARVAGAARFDWKTLALGLVPMAGAGLFVGLSMTTTTQLRAEGWLPAGVDLLRALLLGGAVLWSVWLGLRIVARSPAAFARRAAASLLYLVPVAVFGGTWYLMYFVW